MSISARGLHKTFGPARAVQGVSFDVPPGQIVGLIGPNGSGKTTLLRMLATFIPPSSGRIVVAGHDIQSNPLAVRQAIGYLPEALPGYSEARVEEYLVFRARLKGIGSVVRRREVDRCLAACELQGVRRRLLGRLSQGFRRRVGLADALLGAPPVLLLDEPTVGLDPLQVRQTRALLRQLEPRATVLLSTHLLTEAQATCDRALMLVRGQLVSDLTLDRRSEQGGLRVTLRGAAAACTATVQGIAGVEEVQTVQVDEDRVTLHVLGSDPRLGEQLVRECVSQGLGVCALHPWQEDLEAHFMNIAFPGSGREAA
ncbi:MAG: ABC transporter ATP-binding protein [Planctomycetales bacterium]